MKNRKITFVIGNRAHYARVKPILKYIPGSNYKLLLFESAVLSDYGSVKDQIIAEVGEEKISVMYTNISGGNLVTMTKSTGIAISEFASEFERDRPDIVVVVADRYETLAAATAARYMNIPLAHIQGGENTGLIDDSVRHAITKLANIHLVANEDSAERVEKMGEERKHIYVTGCPTIDLCANLEQKDLRPLFENYAGIRERKFILQEKYIIVAFHPITTEYAMNKKYFDILLRSINDMDIQTIWLYPNIDAGTDIMRQELLRFKAEDKKYLIYFFRHFDIENYLQLLKGARCIVGNSSVGIRESAFFGTPSVNIGSRQRGRVRSENVIDTDISTELIKAAVDRQVQHGHYPPSYLYGDGTAGKKIADILSNCDLTIEKQMTY